MPEAPIPVNDLKRRHAPILKLLHESVAAVLDSGWYIQGPRVRAFEAAFAAYCGVEHCVGTGNGTDALEVALRACGIGPGDQVATVANAGGYATTAILAAGAEPLFVEVDPDSLLIDAASLAARRTARTRAAIVTHLYGRMANMPRVLEAAAGMAVIEDCAQAHGARLKGKSAGAWGAAGCFSFYPTKNLGALGDGGALVTGDAELAERARRLCQYGWKGKYLSTLAGGRNSRLDEIQAAALTAVLPLLETWNMRRRAIARRYGEELDGLAGPARPAGPDDVVHLYVLSVKHRDIVRASLEELGIGTDVHYPVPDHRQAAWSGEPWAAGPLPLTERCCDEILTIPCFPELTDAEVDRVVAALRRTLPPPEGPRGAATVYA